jgi:hypothetical protein
MEQEPILRGPRVLIVGKGEGWDRATELIDSNEWNVWAIPQAYSLLNDSRVDLVFEIHAPEAWRKKKGTIHKLNTVFTRPKLIVPRRVPGWTNNSYLLPVEKIQETGLPLINTFAWMVAYALHRGIMEFAFRGVNLNFEHEGRDERDGMMYILGYLKALEYKLDIDRHSGLARGEVWNLNS